MNEWFVNNWLTPGGHEALMAYRSETNDWNTLTACMTEDEYGLRGRRITGTALDIGAHLGGVTVSLALDNPDLHVIAVEAVPPNVVALRLNVEQNRVADRVTIIEGSAGGGEVDYGFRGTEAAEHHAFIGNSTLGEGTEHETAQPEPVTLSGLIEEYGPVAFAKVDCEGCEYEFLDDPAVAEVPTILGEWHNVGGMTQGSILALLGETHTVIFSGPQDGPGGFVAVAK